MANNYGRGGAALTSAAQRGPAGDYEFTPRAAESYLSGAEQEAYRKALGVLELTPGANNVAAARRNSRAKLQAERLREIASTRALSDFESGGTQYSKPWLQRAPGGLIGEESAGPVGEITLGSLSADVAKRTLNKLAAAQEGQFDAEFFGSPYYRGFAKQQERGARGTPISSILQTDRPLRKRLQLTNPITAYTGVGGVNIEEGLPFPKVRGVGGRFSQSEFWR